MDASASVHTKKIVAHTAVERDRKLALPLAPNRLPAEPLPNDAPMSAPLPCCTSTSPIITSAESSWTTSTMFIRICMDVFSCANLDSARRAAYGDEVPHLQRGATDQSAVDVGLREQRRRVVRLHAAGVEDLHLVGTPAGGRAQLRA